ncbi:hypothetical protein [Pedobacter jejuensis]|nr:hypothetical protein [Pedobacter jejuensis]
MKRFALAFLVALLMLSSCTTNYYLTVSDTETPIYSTANGYDQQGLIEAGKAFIYSGTSRRTPTKYGMISGYSPRIVAWKPLRKLSKKQLELLAFTNDYGYTYDGVPISSYRYGRLAPTSPTYTPSRSYGSGSTKTTKSTGGTVHVKGYTRKDGTYVKPHTRSAPRRH